MRYLELQQVHIYHTRNHYINDKTRGSHDICNSSIFYKFKLHNLLRKSLSGPRLQGLSNLSFISQFVSFKK